MALQLEKENKSLIKNLLFLDGSHKYVSAQTDKYKNTKKIKEIGAENEADGMCTFLMQFVSFEYLRVSLTILFQRIFKLNFYLNYFSFDLPR